MTPWLMHMLKERDVLLALIKSVVSFQSSCLSPYQSNHNANRNAAADPSIINSSPISPASRALAAPDWRPGAPDDAAAPAVPETPAASPPPAVRGALTTTTEVDVDICPSGRVV